MSPKTQKSSPIYIDPDEWDFRTIQEDDLITVLQYEYLRSALPLSLAISNWLKNKFELDKLRGTPRHEAIAVTRYHFRRRAEIQNADIIQFLFDLDQSRFEISLARNILKGTLPELISSPTAQRIATSFERFPEPWLTTKRKMGEAYLKKRMIVIPRDTTVYRCYENSVETDELLAVNREFSEERFLINLSASRENIFGDFKKWLAHEHRGVGGTIQQRAGRRATWERLKWLAAYRISKYGLKFGDAKAFIDAYRIEHPVSSLTGNVLPLFGNQSGWDRAVQKVKNVLSGDFLTEIIANF